MLKVWSGWNRSEAVGVTFESKQEGGAFNLQHVSSHVLIPRQPDEGEIAHS